MLHDSHGHVDLEVAADIRVKEESEDISASTSAPAPNVYFVEKGEWWTASEAAGPHVSQRLVLPRGSDGRVLSKILEVVCVEVKADDVEVVEASTDALPMEELDFLAFDA